MTEALYRRNGGIPAALPFDAFDAKGDHWTDLANKPDGRAACGYVLGPSKPAYDEATQDARWDAASEVWLVERRPPPPPPSKADLLAYAESVFAFRRDGGVTLANGLRIKTDADSRGLISGAYPLTDVRPELVIDFRASGGWVQVDAATMQTVAVAVGSWVQACYSGWRGAEELIGAGAITTFADVDAAAAAVTLSG